MHIRAYAGKNISKGDLLFVCNLHNAPPPHLHVMIGFVKPMANIIRVVNILTFIYLCKPNGKNQPKITPSEGI